ncbi:amidohydrolase family protein [Paenibacillus humicola]|uniref:amidohydrolase family protein n=1 Tax=Paenibacillus humicola TaxID=3110540 RepID=UPI00237C04B3|nr:amidohydrolase family protein [Paenibacillus humicola]
MTIIRIDSHQHYWLTSRNDYGWLQPSLGSMYADYMPEHLKPHLIRFRIDKTIIVQAAPTAEETDFLLELAEREETVAGVVGWLDLESADFEEKLSHYRRNPKFVSFRPMIQDLPSDWIIREDVIGRIKHLTEAGFRMDLQANPRHLSYILQVLEQVPEWHAVIDHIAKPAIGQKEWEPWASQMERIAAYPHIMCKLSGMVSGRTGAPWSKEDIAPYAKHVIDVFGKKRVMFGSDWPICLYSATYGSVVDLFEYCLDDSWTEEELAGVYGGNAARFYGLNIQGSNT